MNINTYIGEGPSSSDKGQDPRDRKGGGGDLSMIHMQNCVRIVYYLYEFWCFYIINIMKFSHIIQMAVLIRYISQEILQYVLIQILKYT
jgi:hypothetical protein